VGPLGALRLDVVTDPAGLDRCRDELNTFADSAPGGGLFVSHDYLGAWLEAYWQPRPFRLLLVRRGGRLVGAVPLLSDERGVSGCRGSLVAPLTFDLPELQANGDLADTLLNGIPGASAPTRLRFKRLDESSEVYAGLRQALPGHRRRCLLHGVLPRPILEIATDWESFLRSKPRHFRNELRRKEKNLERAGAARVLIGTAAGDCQAILDDVMRIEANSWKQQAGTSFTADARAGRFHGTLARRWAEKDALRVYLLYLGAEPVAHIFGAVHRGTYYALKTSYDERYRSVSPGAVLFGHAVRDAFERRFTTFDFLGEESRWKDDWATGMRRLVDICVYPATRLRCAGCVQLTRLARRLESRAPAILAAAQRLRRGLRRRSAMPMA
jgi:CelD/BcsL family acetyltransferase involved in cellulose biosynthesis